MELLTEPSLLAPRRADLRPGPGAGQGGHAGAAAAGRPGPHRRRRHPQRAAPRPVRPRSGHVPGRPDGLLRPAGRAARLLRLEDYADVFDKVTNDAERWAQRFRNSDIYRRYVGEVALELSRRAAAAGGQVALPTPRPAAERRDRRRPPPRLRPRPGRDDVRRGVPAAAAAPPRPSRRRPMRGASAGAAGPGAPAGRSRSPRWRPASTGSPRPCSATPSRPRRRAPPRRGAGTVRCAARAASRRADPPVPHAVPADDRGHRLRPRLRARSCSACRSRSALLSHTVPGDKGLGPDPEGFSLEAQRLLVVLVIGAAFMGVAVAIREIVNEASIYRRERAIGLSPGVPGLEARRSSSSSTRSRCPVRLPRAARGADPADALVIFGNADGRDHRGGRRWSRSRRRCSACSPARWCKTTEQTTPILVGR